MSEIDHHALGSNEVCCCDYEWSDEELYDLTDDAFEEEPCAVCQGRVVSDPSPLWAAEEEDDC